MLFFIGFGILTLVLIILITAIAQPPHRWVEHYIRQNPSQLPPKQAVEAPPPQD